jgi:hypothetical protein
MLAYWAEQMVMLVVFNGVMHSGASRMVRVGGTSVALISALVVSGYVVSTIKKSLETGDPSWLARGTLLVLALAYVLLIWRAFLSS